MWYVNLELYKCECGKSHPFYINYVVCKLVFLTPAKALSISFYINYVVCKFEIIVFGVDFKSRFILTMWYVNRNKR